MTVASRSHAGVPKGRRLGTTVLAVLGWILLLAGLTFLVSDLVTAYMTESYRPKPAGEIWFELDVASLNLVQAMITASFIRSSPDQETSAVAKMRRLRGFL